MKYVVRAIKHFFCFVVLLTVIMGIFILAGLVEPAPESLFRDGWNSVLQILGLFALVSAVYPKIAYATRTATVPGETSETRNGIVSLMEERGYVLEKTEGENMSFRLSSPLGRFRRLWEDRVTFIRTIDGYALEGPNKDIVRLVNALEMKFNPFE